MRQAGSLVAACELLVAACMRDLVPRPGIKPGPPALGAWRLIHCATRVVPRTMLLIPSKETVAQRWPMTCPGLRSRYMGSGFQSDLSDLEPRAGSASETGLKPSISAGPTCKGLKDQMPLPCGRRGRPMEAPSPRLGDSESISP